MLPAYARSVIGADGVGHPDVSHRSYIHAIGRKPIAVVASALVSTQRNILFNGWVWAVFAHPGWLAALLFCIGVWRCALGSALRGGAGYSCRNLLVICLLFFGSCAVYQSHQHAVKYPAPGSGEYLYFRRNYQAHTWGNKLTGLRDELTRSPKIGRGSMAQRLACRLYASAFMRLRAFRMISAHRLP